MRQQMILTPHDGFLVIRFANYSYLPVLEKKRKINEKMLFRYKKRDKNVTCQRQHHKEPLDEPKTVSNKKHILSSSSVLIIDKRDRRQNAIALGFIETYIIAILT